MGSGETSGRAKGRWRGKATDFGLPLEKPLCALPALSDKVRSRQDEAAPGANIAATGLLLALVVVAGPVLTHCGRDVGWFGRRSVRVGCDRCLIVARHGRRAGKRHGEKDDCDQNGQQSSNVSIHSPACCHRFRARTYIPIQSLCRMVARDVLTSIKYKRRMRVKVSSSRARVSKERCLSRCCAASVRRAAAPLPLCPRRLRRMTYVQCSETAR